MVSAGVPPAAVSTVPAPFKAPMVELKVLRSKVPVTVTGTLDLNTFSSTIGALNGAGTVDTAAGGTPALTIGNNGNNGTFSGTIQNSAGALSLVKVGAGTETLSGGFTYSGNTV